MTIHAGGRGPGHQCRTASNRPPPGYVFVTTNNGQDFVTTTINGVTYRVVTLAS